MNMLSQYREQLKDVFFGIKKSPYFYIVLMFLGILIMIIGILFILNKNTGVSKKTVVLPTSTPQENIPSSRIPKPSDYEEPEEAVINSKTLKATITERAIKYPLTQYLPEKIGSIMLDYDVNDDGSVQYVVRPLPNQSYREVEYESQVNAFIKSKGVDPSTLHIVWE